MEFRCEDLPQHGVFLIPSSSPDYAPLLADIQRRLDDPVEGSPPFPESLRPRIHEEDRERSAILVNRSSHAIATIHQVWTFEEANGRQYTSSIGSGSNSSVILPFGMSEQSLKLYGYWHTVLPGSKRYLNSRGEQAGDNTDVRLPAGDELWLGGIAGGRAGGGSRPAQIDRLTLTLDGVFFVDGGFAGPNHAGMWERVVYTAEAHAQVANIARHDRDGGVAVETILSHVAELTGPPPDHPRMHRSGGNETDSEFHRRAALEMIAWRITKLREHAGAHAAVVMLLSWVDARPPAFHKL